MKTANIIRQYIVDDLAWPGDPDVLTDDYSLIENSVIDSLGIYQVVAFIEEHFATQVDITELVPENFETIGAIAQLVDRKAG